MRQKFLQVYAQVLKEIAIVRRDKHALGVLFLMPACFVFLLSLALEDLYREKTGRILTVAIADGGSSGSETGRDLKIFLDKIGGFELNASNDDKDDAVLVRISLSDGIDKTLDEMLNTQTSAQEKIKLSVVFAQTLEPAYRQFVKGMLANFLYERFLARLEKRLALDTGGATPKIKPDVRAFISDASTSDGEVRPNPLQQNVPGWSLFAMFFIALPLAGNVIRERSDGTFKRILCFPISRSAIIIGKVLPYIFINMVQFLLMLGVGLFLLPAVSDLRFDAGGNPWLLLLITLVVGFTTTSFAVMVATVSKSVEHATALVGAFVIIFSVIGGIMVPVFAMPPFMQDLANYSPLYWAHQAYLDVMVAHKSFVAVAFNLYKLMAFSLVCALLSMWRFRWL